MNRREFLAASAAVAVAPLAAAEAAANPTIGAPGFLDIQPNTKCACTYYFRWNDTRGYELQRVEREGCQEHCHVGTTWFDNPKPIIDDVLALHQQMTAAGQRPVS